MKAAELFTIRVENFTESLQRNFSVNFLFWLVKHLENRQVEVNKSSTFKTSCDQRGPPRTSRPPLNLRATHLGVAAHVWEAGQYAYV